jgi:hypothetical protein
MSTFRHTNGRFGFRCREDEQADMLSESPIEGLPYLDHITFPVQVFPPQPQNFRLRIPDRTPVRV